MKKEIIFPYEIRLDYGNNAENPSRLFHSFADLIDGINKLDILIAKSVNTSVSSKTFLRDIEKGSIISKFWKELTVSENGIIDNANNKESIREHIENTRSKSIQFIADQKHSIKDLVELAGKINTDAQEKKLTDTFNYSKPSLEEIAASLNSINKATDNLKSNENYSIESPTSKVENLTSGTPKIDIEELETSLTHEEIINTSILYYKIKKPDFLSDSQWDFKFDKRTVKVKILDTIWLEKFLSGEIVVVPGDSLKVKTNNIIKYSKDGQVISNKTEIIEVLEIKRQS